jgi:molybdenum cofactor synthesis domain-containing protein
MDHTASLILVGTELVAGALPETNREFLVNELQSVGIVTRSVHIVRDEVGQVAELVSYMAGQVATVITVGGLGPTVDDITLEAVARAFGMTTSVETAMDSTSLSAMSGSETVQPRLRCMPHGAEVISTHHGPVVRVDNVYCLPGLPRLVRARFHVVRDRLRTTNRIQIHRSLEPGGNTTLLLESLSDVAISQCVAVIRDTAAKAGVSVSDGVDANSLMESL